MLKIQRLLIVIFAFGFIDSMALAHPLTRTAPKRAQVQRARRVVLARRNLDCTEDQAKSHLYHLYSNFVNSKPRVNRMVEASSGEGACIISAAFVKAPNGELRYFPRSGPRADRSYAISFRKFDELMTKFQMRYRLLEKEIVVADNSAANSQGSMMQGLPPGSANSAMPVMQPAAPAAVFHPASQPAAANQMMRSNGPSNGQIATMQEGR